jgi:hypothetical protein
LYKYFESVSEWVRSTVDPPGLEPLRALKWSSSFPLLSLFLLGVKLSLPFISELLKVVSTGVGLLFGGFRVDPRVEFTLDNWDGQTLCS